MNKQRGITLIGAIFILIIISLLGKYIVNITGAQQQSSTMRIQSARAFHAARSGLAWGMSSLENTRSASLGCLFMKEKIITFPAIPNFPVSLSCSHLGTFIESNQPTDIYKLTAHATFGVYGNLSYVSRKQSITLHLQPDQ